MAKFSCLPILLGIVSVANCQLVDSFPGQDSSTRWACETQFDLQLRDHIARMIVNSSLDSAELEVLGGRNEQARVETIWQGGEDFLTMPTLNLEVDLGSLVKWKLYLTQEDTRFLMMDGTGTVSESSSRPGKVILGSSFGTVRVSALNSPAGGVPEIERVWFRYHLGVGAGLVAPLLPSVPVRSFDRNYRANNLSAAEHVAHLPIGIWSVASIDFKDTLGTVSANHLDSGWGEVCRLFSGVRRDSIEVGGIGQRLFIGDSILEGWRHHRVPAFYTDFYSNRLLQCGAEELGLNGGVIPNFEAPYENLTEPFKLESSGVVEIEVDRPALPLWEEVPSTVGKVPFELGSIWLPDPWSGVRWTNPWHLWEVNQEGVMPDYRKSESLPKSLQELALWEGEHQWLVGPRTDILDPDRIVSSNHMSPTTLRIGPSRSDATKLAFYANNLAIPFSSSPQFALIATYDCVPELWQFWVESKKQKEIEWKSRRYPASTSPTQIEFQSSDLPFGRFMTVALRCSAYLEDPNSSSSEADGAKTYSGVSWYTTSEIVVQREFGEVARATLTLPETEALFVELVAIYDFEDSDSPLYRQEWAVRDGSYGDERQLNPMLYFLPKVHRPSKPIEIKPHQHNIVEWK